MTEVKYNSHKVGNVILHTPTTLPPDTYSDKGAEDVLLEIFKGKNPEEERRKVLANNPTWPLYYHLNYRRGNLLRWYDFKSDAKVLEIGAGCGGITEELVNHDITVTALELAEKRALINAHRNKKAKNLEIFIGNLENFNNSELFDYIVCVGVLEYAGTFIHSKDPYLDFVKMLHKFLKPGGKLLLAIENRLGLKYWTGAKEDHVHTFFEGHNGYPSPKKVQTFGREELSKLFIASGFTSTYFYYPYPDYKNPSFVYSDDYYPGNYATFPLSTLPTPTLDRPRETFLSEQSLMRYIEANNLFPQMSNSFLIEGTL